MICNFIFSNLQASEIRVRCGEWDVKSANEPRDSQARRVEDIIIHPKYSGIKRVENDYALLFTVNDFKLDAHIDTICLPKFPDQRRGQYERNQCVAMGWGVDRFNSQNYQVSMKQVTLPIVDNGHCQTQLRENTRLRPTFKLDDSFLCAGGKEFEDTCEGDGGGPLVCPSLQEPGR
jgi:kallikrein